MTEFINTTGIVLRAEMYDDYDKRLVLLTNTHGKISVFAKGARRPNNKFMAATDLFCFGDFKLYPGRNSYSLSDVNIKNYFSDLRSDFNKAVYGMYFLEIMDYNTRENNDEVDMMKLLYQSLRALISKEFDNRLVKLIFEIKTMMLLGEFYYSPKANDNSTALYTLDYLYKTKAEKVFSFKITDEAMNCLFKISKEAKDKIWNGHVYKSEEMLKVVEI